MAATITMQLLKTHLTHRAELFETSKTLTNSKHSLVDKKFDVRAM